MYSLKLKWFWLVLGFLGAAIMVHFSLVPRLPGFIRTLEMALPGGLSQGDKSLHFLANTVVMLYTVQVFRRRHHFRVALFLVLFGGVLECLQGFSLKRSPEELDFIANMAGAALGWYLGGMRISRLLRLVEFHLNNYWQQTRQFFQPRAAHSKPLSFSCRR